MLSDAIIKRKSVRKYSSKKFSDAVKAEIAEKIKELSPMFDDAATYFKLVPENLIRDELSGMLVTAPYYIIISSDGKDGDLENIGYMAEQLVLKLTEMGIGTCFCGMGKPKQSSSINGVYGITLALGYPAESESFRQSRSDFKRKNIEDFLLGDKESDFYLPFIEAARLAPSAINRQPVLFEMNVSSIDIYRKKPVMEKMDSMQRVDAGIAAAHIFAVASDKGYGVEFFKKGTELREKYIYVISIKLV